MRINTGYLTGAQLDWAVAKCEGVTEGKDFAWYYDRRDTHKYSTDWAQGGPIIEREGISLECRNGDWIASYAGFPSLPYFSYEPLVSAMRCYVASKLGDEIEVPDELKEEV